MQGAGYHKDRRDYAQRFVNHFMRSVCDFRSIEDPS